jgi:hypothetical protein
MSELAAGRGRPLRAEQVGDTRGRQDHAGGDQAEAGGAAETAGVDMAGGDRVSEADGTISGERRSERPRGQKKAAHARSEGADGQTIYSGYPHHNFSLLAWLPVWRLPVWVEKHARRERALTEINSPADDAA